MGVGRALQVPSGTVSTFIGVAFSRIAPLHWLRNAITSGSSASSLREMATFLGASIPIFTLPPITSVTVTTMPPSMTTFSPHFLLNTSMSLLHE